MTNRITPQYVQTNCHASREFLLNAPIIPENRVQHRPPLEATIERFRSKFPAMKSGEAFIGQWPREQDDAIAFGAMAFKIDTELAEPKSKGDENDRLFHLAGVLDEMAAAVKGGWGFVYEEILGLFMPGHDQAKQNERVKHIRSAFGAQKSGNLSIGMASFPSDHFPVESIMQNAVKALDHAAFLGPDNSVIFDAVSLNISGDRLYAQGDFQGSINEFECALSLDPTNVNVKNSLGVCYGVLKHYEKALFEFETAIRLAPNEVMAVYNYGLVKLLTHHPNQALTYFQQAEEIRDDIFEVAFHIAKVYLQLDQPEKGLNYLYKAEALNTKSAGVYRLMGRCQAALGAYDQAIAAYTRAIRINPNDAEALSDLGRQYDLRNENLEIATLFCERSIQMEPQNGHFHHRLGRLYLKAEKISLALTAFEQAHTLGYDSRATIDEVSQLLPGNSDEASTM